MASISFNARNGISVGSALPLSDALGNVTAASLSVSGASTLSSLSLTSLNVSGAVSFAVSPTGITSTQNTNTLALATTAFVLGQKGSATPIMNGSGYAGVSTLFASQDHVHPSDNSLATNLNPSLSGIVTISGGTVTSSVPFLTMSQTWNNVNSTFNGIYANIINTTSGANSLLLNFQMNGVQQFGISASGTLIQTVTTSNLARTIISKLSELRTIREYQDLNDGLVGGTQGLDVNSVTEFSDIFNARWDQISSTYIKDRSLAGDHVSANRLTEDYKYQWYFSDGTAPTSTIAWSKRVEFDLPASVYTFNGILNTTNLHVSGSVTSGLNLTTGNIFSINSVPVLSATTIGTSIVTSSLTSVGTLTTGVWNATTIPVTNGGTGASSQTTALSNLMPVGAVNGYVLTTSGAGSYYWASPTGSTAPVGTTIQSSRTLATATAGQTVFATPTYIPGASQLRVYINGIRQFSTEYSETTTTSFTLTAPGAALNDIVFIEIDGYINYSWSALATTFTPTGLITSTNVQGAIADLEARKASHTDTIQIGTTSIILNRTAASQTLTGISIDGNSVTANTATNVAYSGLTGIVPTWNQNTTGTAATSTNALSLGGALANTFAPLASPNLSGIPTAPTAAPGTNTTQVASTGFVASSIAPLQKNVVFSAHSNDTQSLAVNVWTKILFPIIDFDNTAAYNVTISRFTPQVAGYYQVSATISVYSSICYIDIGIFKNGAVWKFVEQNTAPVASSNGTSLVHCNGTTDYLEIYSHIGIAQLIQAYSTFQAVLVARD